MPRYKIRTFRHRAYQTFGVANLIMVAAALHFWGATEVRNHGSDLFFLLLAGGFWLALANSGFSWLGLNFQDDVVERRNDSALIAVGSALTAVTIIYAAGNLGEGPSFMENFFSAGLGTASWFCLWFLLEGATRISAAITEERNLAAGIRLGGFLLATGLILGRAVAGDWHSTAATLHDFIHDAWPVMGLWVAALGVEQFAQPTRQRPFPHWFIYGALPGLVYLTFAGGWLWHLGRWEGMPR